MGASCCGGSSAGTAAPSPKHFPKGSSPAFTTKNNTITNNTKKNRTDPNNVVAAEENRTRVREKALHNLLESLRNGDTVVPSLRWRRQYLKINGIGLEMCKTISEFLQKNSSKRNNRGNGSQQGTTAGNSPPSPKGASTAPHLKSPISSTANNSTSNAEVEPWVESLDLRSFKIGDEGLAVLAPGLLADRMLKSIFLSSNNITDEGVRHFSKFILDPSRRYQECQIELFVFSDNPISSEGIRLLCQSLKLLRGVRRLEIGRGRSTDVDVEGELLSREAVESIIDFVNESPLMSSLIFKGTGDYFNSTGFSPDGLKQLVTALVGRSKLSELYLQECYNTKPGYSGGFAASVFNKRPNSGGKTPVSPLSVANRTETVDMTALLSPIHDLATSLQSHTTHLQTLVLRFPLSDEAVASLSHGIAHNTQLRNLSLRGCDMSAQALAMLGNAMKMNTGIETLDVSYQSNFIAHPLVLSEMRSSSKRRQSNANMAVALEHTQAPSFANYVSRHTHADEQDELPTKDQREHPLLPIIRAMNTNSHLYSLIMIGINIQTSDIEELCSCLEVGGNRSLCEVTYTTTGSQALKMKLDNFLMVNKENYMRTNAPSVATTLSSRVKPAFDHSMGSFSNERDYMENSLSEATQSYRASAYGLNGGVNGGGNVTGQNPNHASPYSYSPNTQTLDDDIFNHAPQHNNNSGTAPGSSKNSQNQKPTLSATNPGYDKGLNTSSNLDESNVRLDEIKLNMDSDPANNPESAFSSNPTDFDKSTTKRFAE